MSTNHLFKTTLHSIVALMTAYYAATCWPQMPGRTALFAGLALMFAVLAFTHQRWWPGSVLRTSLFFLLNSIVLAIMAWMLYQQQQHKLTFFYEGVSVFFLSLAAFAFILRRKREVLFEEEQP